MRDDALDAIDVNDFWFDDSALDADSTPVQSLDFGLLLGDEVPRDGLQRPLLTSGSPVRTPVRTGNRSTSHTFTRQWCSNLGQCRQHAQRLWPRAHRASPAWRAP